MSAPRVIDCPGGTLAPEVFEEVAAHLRTGRLLAYPTDTVYGFGGLAREDALRALTALKHRERTKPFVLLLPDAPDVRGLEWDACARRLAERFWPGPLTLVLTDPEGAFPAGVRSEHGAVAVRRSSDPFVTELLAHLGEPITSTSANPPRGTPAVSGSEALEAALSLGADEQLWVIDAGAATGAVGSTIVDCTRGRPVVIRRGAVSVERLKEAWPNIDE